MLPFRPAESRGAFPRSCPNSQNLAAKGFRVHQRRQDERRGVKAMFTTRDEFRNCLQEISTWIAAACIGLAMIMVITVVFMPLGMWLVLGGAVIFLLGWALSWLVPNLWHYRPVKCPYCWSSSQVRLGIGRFLCGGCARLVKIKMGNGKEKNMLTLLLTDKKVV